MRTDPDVHKSDVSFQVHPNRLTLKVKGDPLLSGDLPEAVNIDGMNNRQPCTTHSFLFSRAGHLKKAVLCGAGCFWFLEDTSDGRMIHVTLEKQIMGHESWPSPFEPEPEPDASVTHRTFFEVAVGAEPHGKVVFGLFGNALPKTVENFRALCAGDKVQHLPAYVPDTSRPYCACLLCDDRLDESHYAHADMVFVQQKAAWWVLSQRPLYPVVTFT